MAAAIHVEKTGAEEFRVTVSEGGSQTAHSVTVQPSYHQKLTQGKVSTEELIQKSFEFLLEREPKESILRRFELPVIGRYFPDYERTLRRRLGL